MYDRYADIEKFITDPDKLQITNGSEVYISSENCKNTSFKIQLENTDSDALKKAFEIYLDGGVVLNYLQRV